MKNRSKINKDGELVIFDWMKIEATEAMVNLQTFIHFIRKETVDVIRDGKTMRIMCTKRLLALLERDADAYNMIMSKLQDRYVLNQLC